jgi:hypothetical protein
VAFDIVGSVEIADDVKQAKQAAAGPAFDLRNSF